MSELSEGISVTSFDVSSSSSSDDAEDEMEDGLEKQVRQYFAHSKMSVDRKVYLGVLI